MRAVTRARTIPAQRQRVWDVISDPYHLPRWWPSVARVEDATSTAWTMVLTTPRGRTVRADYTRTEWREPARIAWRQELEDSPFERIFAAASVEIELEPVSDAGTRVAIRALEQLRGRFRFGGFLVRRAARRRLDEALEGLQRALEP